MHLTRRAAHTQLNKLCGERLQAAREAGTLKVEYAMTTPQKAKIRLEDRKGELVNFCSNNYLGLANHPTIEKAAVQAINDYGFGLASGRIICGTQVIHKQLEGTLAEFHEMEDSILYPSCFDANAGIFEALLGPDDAVISDALNHASIIDGIRLCKAKRFRYEHLSMEDLEKKLIEAKDARLRMIVTDGVFSMDGDFAPLKQIRELADKYDAIIFVDDCHATGFIGENGKGTPELWGVKVDIVNTTLGKAMGGATGGYTVASKEVVNMLRNVSRPYMFSNSVSPAVIGASQAAYELLKTSTELRKNLVDNTEYLRQSLSEAGFTVIGHPSSPIVPVMLGDASLAAEFAKRMIERGIYVIGFSFPIVPLGAARIRVQVSASHTKDQMQKLVAAFNGVGKELGVLDLYIGEANEVKKSQMGIINEEK